MLANPAHYLDSRGPPLLQRDDAYLILIGTGQYLPLRIFQICLSNTVFLARVQELCLQLFISVPPRPQGDDLNMHRTLFEINRLIWWFLQN